LIKKTDEEHPSGFYSAFSKEQTQNSAVYSEITHTLQ
jgi:hypothetical protein